MGSVVKSIKCVQKKLESFPQSLQADKSRRDLRLILQASPTSNSKPDRATRVRTSICHQHQDKISSKLLASHLQ